MKVYAPVKNASGVWASVRFIDGVGECDNPRLLQWFKAHGYKLENDDGKVIESTPGDQTFSQKTGINVDLMTSEELRNFLIEKGLGNKVRSTRARDKLLKILEDNIDLVEV